MPDNEANTPTPRLPETGPHGFQETLIKGFLYDALTGAFLHTGGAKAVFSL